MGEGGGEGASGKRGVQYTVGGGGVYRFMKNYTMIDKRGVSMGEVERAWLLDGVYMGDGSDLLYPIMLPSGLSTAVNTVGHRARYER